MWIWGFLMPGIFIGLVLSKIKLVKLGNEGMASLTFCLISSLIFWVSIIGGCIYGFIWLFKHMFGI